jgi:hypothetical protein
VFDARGDRRVYRTNRIRENRSTGCRRTASIITAEREAHSLSIW